MTSTIHGGRGVPVLSPILNLLEFRRGWVAYFESRRAAAGASIFRTHMGVQAVTILDPHAVAVVFDHERVKKRYGIGPLIPPRELVGGITPTMFLNDEEHRLQKRFWLELLAERADDLLPTFDAAMERAVARWLAQGAFRWGPELEQLYAEAVFRWLLDIDGDPDVLNTWLSKIFTRFKMGAGWRAACSAWSQLVATVRDAPRFADIEARARSTGMSAEEVAANLVFTLGFNSWAGLVGLGRSSVASMSLHPELHEQLDSASSRAFVAEVLRLRPPVNFFYGEARSPLTVESRGQSYAIEAGELLHGVVWFVHRDPAVWREPLAFDPSRFDDPTALRHLVWANGPGDGAPTASNKMCAGRDPVMLLTARLVEALASYRWELQEAPAWSEVDYPRAGGPADPMDVTRFRRA